MQSLHVDARYQILVDTLQESSRRKSWSPASSGLSRLVVPSLSALEILCLFAVLSFLAADFPLYAASSSAFCVALSLRSPRFEFCIPTSFLPRLYSCFLSIPSPPQPVSRSPLCSACMLYFNLTDRRVSRCELLSSSVTHANEVAPVMTRSLLTLGRVYQRWMSSNPMRNSARSMVIRGNPISRSPAPSLKQPRSDRDVVESWCSQHARVLEGGRRARLLAGAGACDSPKPAHRSTRPVFVVLWWYYLVPRRDSREGFGHPCWGILRWSSSGGPVSESAELGAIPRHAERMELIVC